jgi:hypothetical protein
MSHTHNLLLIGGSNVGKTHFVAQLYRRLVNPGGRYRMVTPPADLTLIQAVLERLASGRAGDHTPRGVNEEIQFVVADQQATIELTFPDYAGEQVQFLVTDRLVSRRWQELVAASGEWLLFIRLDTIPPLEDVTSRGLAYIDDMKARPQPDQHTSELSMPAFVVELLQMLLHLKSVAVLSPVAAPRLTVALSCWDRLGLAAGTKPTDELRRRLPLVYAFLEAGWQPANWRVCGLSALGQDLDANTPDEAYADAGPENAGFIVLPSGEKTPDLTHLIRFTPA